MLHQARKQWEQRRVLTEMTCSDGLSLPDRTPVVPRFRTKDAGDPFIIRDWSTAYARSGFYKPPP